MDYHGIGGPWVGSSVTDSGASVARKLVARRAAQPAPAGEKVPCSQELEPGTQYLYMLSHPEVNRVYGLYMEYIMVHKE